jgi:hypothetical protein
MYSTAAFNPLPPPTYSKNTEYRILVEHKITNVRVVYMGQDEDLKGANSFRGPLEEAGPENRTFWDIKSKASAIWGQKSRDFQMVRVMNLPPSESLSPSTI